MDGTKRLIFELRIIILILLLIFFFMFNSLPKTDCQACLFIIDEKKYSSENFFNLYSDKCLLKKETLEDLILKNNDLFSNICYEEKIRNRKS